MDQTAGDSNIDSVEVERLVLEHKGWAESLARVVAKGWALDSESDGLISASFEALILCAKRFDPTIGVPFRAYAKKRVHEAATDEARRSRAWKMGFSVNSKNKEAAREISAKLFDVFPDLHDGDLSVLSKGMTDGSDSVRVAIRQLLIAASLFASKSGTEMMSPEELLDFKKLLVVVSDLDEVHQAILWRVYWEGDSLRGVAQSWNMDELNIIREHQALLAFLHRRLTIEKQLTVPPPKVRPGLRHISADLKKKREGNPFSQLLEKVSYGG